MKLEKLIPVLNKLHDSRGYSDGSYDQHNVIVHSKEGKLIGRVVDARKDGIVNKEGIEETQLVLILDT